MNERRDRIRVHIEGKEYSVVGGQFQDMLAAVKQINGRRFVGALKVWKLPGSAEEIQHQLDLSGYWLEGGTPVSETAQTESPAPARAGGDRIRVRLQGHELAVVGGSFGDMLEAVKGVPGRRFDAESKIWEIPGEVAIIKHLIETAGFQLEGAEKISTGPVSKEMPPLDFANETSAAPPSFEEPDFFDDDDVPPYEPPDWWDDDNMPPPAVEPPDWWEEEMAARPTEEPQPIDSQPPAPAGPTLAPAPPARGSDQIRIRVGGIPLVVTGGEFRQMLDVVKKIPGRRFDGQDKVWDIPADVGIESVQQAVNAAGFLLQRG